MRGERSVNSSAVRSRPQACTSSAPKLDTPTSATQIGSVVTDRISSSFDGHSSIAHRFQSSGNPCTAITSRCSSTPLPAMLAMNSGSIGEMPPSTRGRSGLAALIALHAAIAIAAKRDQSGSTSGSQCDLLFGSFHTIAASIMAAAP